MHRYLVFILTVFCSVISYAQNSGIDRSGELQMNAKIPDWPSFRVIQHANPTIRIEAIKDKVIILDFFTTYCTNCIESLPKLQALQDKMKQQVEIIIVTPQDKATIEKFFKTNKLVKENKVRLPIIYSDTTLIKSFPFLGVPHVAWIYKEKVQAITHSDFITQKNIGELYSKGNIKLPRKNDFMDATTLTNSSLIGSVALSRYKDGVPQTGLKFEFDSLTQFRKTSFYNMSVAGAYTSIFFHMQKTNFLIANRVVWEVSDSSKYEHPTESGNPNEWMVNNAICYERYDTVRRSEKEQASLLLKDLNNFLGMEVSWGKKVRKCTVIQQNGPPAKSENMPKEGMNVEGSAPLCFFLDYSGKFAIAVDESGFKGKMILPDYNNLAELNKHLSFYGLKAIEAEREVDVLIFRELHSM
ncbi:redoxin domain-containing protein [Chitinophaga defluvii]|uniref:Redoxin domain-containing protein n=1 Tax=Chitinophaga defluvii TaxID=3163343 RepID=A0ABV2TBC7_9BACT